MMAILKTRCGCEQLLELQDFLPVIIMPLHVNVNTSNAITENIQLLSHHKNRRFEYRRKLSNETAIYDEVS